MTAPYAAAGDIRRHLADCERGCLYRGQHIPNCPDHDTCDGCLPRPADIGHYCQKCAFQLRDTIDEIPGLIDALYVHGEGRLAQPDRPNTGDPTRRATKVDQISPSPAQEAADEAARWLHMWAVDIADTIGERGPFEYQRTGIPVPNPSTEARYLTSRLSTLCAHPAVNDLNDEARQLRHRLTLNAGTDRGDQRIPTPCPHCGRRTLMRPNGDDEVRCRNRECAIVWTSDQLGILARQSRSA